MSSVSLLPLFIPPASSEQNEVIQSNPSIEKINASGLDCLRCGAHFRSQKNLRNHHWCFDHEQFQRLLRNIPEATRRAEQQVKSLLNQPITDRLRRVLQPCPDSPPILPKGTHRLRPSAHFPPIPLDQENKKP